MLSFSVMHYYVPCYVRYPHSVGHVPWTFNYKLSLDTVIDIHTILLHSYPSARTWDICWTPEPYPRLLFVIACFQGTIQPFPCNLHSSFINTKDVTTISYDIRLTELRPYPIFTAARLPETKTVRSLVPGQQTLTNILTLPVTSCSGRNLHALQRVVEL